MGQSDPLIVRQKTTCKKVGWVEEAHPTLPELSERQMGQNGPPQIPIQDYEGGKMNFKEAYQTVLKDYPDIMSVEETSKALGVSTKTVYKMLKNGTIQNMKVGRAYRIPKVHLLSFLKINMAKA